MYLFLLQIYRWICTSEHENRLTTDKVFGNNKDGDIFDAWCYKTAAAATDAAGGWWRRDVSTASVIYAGYDMKAGQQ